MNTKKLNEMSPEELLKSRKLLRVVTYMLACVLLALFVLNIFVFLRKGFNASLVVPVALLPIVILNLSTLKAIKKEMDSRKVS